MSDSPRIITKAQADARRRNARRSTGPRTPAGKAASSRNAIRHGLYSKVDPVVDVGLFAEDPDVYRALVRDLVALFEPEGVLERELVDQLASVLWRLRRLQGLEAAALAGSSYLDLEADRRRGEVEHLLLIERYLRGDATEEEVAAGRGAVDAWLGDGGDEEGDTTGSSGHRDGTAEGLAAEVERRACEQWGSLDAAADQALAEAQHLAEEFSTDRHEWVGASLQMLIADDVLYRMSRPEAHLARQRNQLIDQLWTLQQPRHDVDE